MRLWPWLLVAFVLAEPELSTDKWSGCGEVALPEDAGTPQRGVQIGGPHTL